MTRTLAAAAGLLLCVSYAGLASAHEGHGPANPHWHVSDLFGLFAVLAVAAGWIVWRSRK